MSQQSVHSVARVLRAAGFTNLDATIRQKSDLISRMGSFRRSAASCRKSKLLAMGFNGSVILARVSFLALVARIEIIGLTRSSGKSAIIRSGGGRLQMLKLAILLGSKEKPVLIAARWSGEIEARARRIFERFG